MQVMVKHLVVHLGLSVNPYVFAAISFFGGVPIFFAICGLVIWFSLERGNSFSQYCKKRFLRIYPELWVGVIFEILVILFLYDGFTPITLFLFALAQGSVLQFWSPDSLNGFGCGTPNGALWTIGITIQFYLLVFIIFKLLHKKKLFIWISTFIGSVLLSYFGNLFFEILGINLLVKLFSQTVFRHLWLFIIGCFIAEFFDKIVPFISRFWALFLIAAIPPFLSGFGLHLGNYNLLWALPLCIGIIGFAYRFKGIKIKLDISYGIFIYHMIIANVFITFSLVGNWIYLVLVVIISLSLAYLTTVIRGKFIKNA